ncbi:hypothetical protein IP87_03130 [beta proteobacterium AAP121]|nr:hypothetical protein IP80_11570 [beta proteobacterium AAP65]KPG00347.1 hypothetical protein IP87_03130 [beta proteobacterium AAP121]
MTAATFSRRPLLKSAALVTAVLALALSLPPLRVFIEQSMVWHMLVQMPLLVLAGACAAAVWPQALGGRWARCNRYGLTGFMLAQCITAYWMVPALVDRAVVLPSADAGKLATLWLAGVALRQGWVQAPLAVQLFFLGYGLPMMAWLGFYFLSTDLRLCNAYSLESQLRTGQGLLALSAALGAAWAASLWRQLARAGEDAATRATPGAAVNGR